MVVILSDVRSTKSKDPVKVRALSILAPYFSNTRNKRLFHAQVLQNFRNDGIHEFFDALRFAVELRRSRNHNRPRQSHSLHILNVDQVVRHLARHYYKRSAFLEANIRRAHKQVVRSPRRNAAKRSHGARHHRHASNIARTARAFRKKIIHAAHVFAIIKKRTLVFILKHLFARVRHDERHLMMKALQVHRRTGRINAAASARHSKHKVAHALPGLCKNTPNEIPPSNILTCLTSKPHSSAILQREKFQNAKVTAFIEHTIRFQQGATGVRHVTHAKAVQNHVKLAFCKRHFHGIELHSMRIDFLRLDFGKHPVRKITDYSRVHDKIARTHATRFENFAERVGKIARATAQVQQANFIQIARHLVLQFRKRHLVNRLFREHARSHHLLQTLAAIPAPQHILITTQKVIQKIVTASNAIEHLTHGTFHIAKCRNKKRPGSISRPRISP